MSKIASAWRRLPFLRVALPAITAFALAAVLAVACGGGKEESPSATATPTVATATRTAATATHTAVTATPTVATATPTAVTATPTAAPTAAPSHSLPSRHGRTASPQAQTSSNHGSVSGYSY